MDADLLVIGGGIVGCAVALSIVERFPGLSVLLLEKEHELAQHQTGHNSGVIHAGVYYAPGSKKAEFCREGSAATVAFCREHGVAFDQCGKLIVATDALECERLDALQERCIQNGLDPERLDRAALREREPNITGEAAILVRSSGIVDYPHMTRVMAQRLVEQGGQIRTSQAVLGVREEADHVVVETQTRKFRVRNVVACAGLGADRIARMCGLGLDFRIVPFRGEYYRLPARNDQIVRHLVYPVPDPSLPFLGVHLTRMIGGYVTVGPNAVLALAREGYRWTDISPRDLAELARFGGFWKLLRQHGRSGLVEMKNSLHRRGYLELCRKYCPSLRLDDLQPYPAGVRAQAVLADGSLVHDFLIRHTRRTLHVCNAPSPAATAALPIGRHVAAELTRHLGLVPI